MTRTDTCHLCGGADSPAAHDVPPDASIIVCATCRPQLEPDAALDPKHWYCLQDSIWSETPAVQVVSYRLLKRLADETWARDLLDQAYLDDGLL